MQITQKTQYALRALHELAKRRGEGPVKISEIAAEQAIPRRFLEVILNQLKHSGIIVSKRGYYGGYELAQAPDVITVGDVFRAMQKVMTSLQCMACGNKKTCPFVNSCIFRPLWHKVEKAIFDIYDQTTIQDLMQNENRNSSFHESSEVPGIRKSL